MSLFEGLPFWAELDNLVETMTGRTAAECAASREAILAELRVKYRDALKTTNEKFPSFAELYGDTEPITSFVPPWTPRRAPGRVRGLKGPTPKVPMAKARENYAVKPKLGGCGTCGIMLNSPAAQCCELAGCPARAAA